MTGRMLLGTVLALAIAGPMPVAAQARQQQDRMQDRLARMDATLQRMDRVRDRIQQLDRDIARQMDRIRDQDRLREHQRLRDMCDASQKMVQEMRRNMEQLREMAGSAAVGANQEMQQEMERLRQHWEGAADQIENGLQIMERLRDQLGKSG